MSKFTPIKILEKGNNKRGNLFGRLMSDLFLALGYDDVRLNIHKTGREVDVEAIHRTEKRRVVAECKATKTKTGGDDVNKFVGALDAEKRMGKENHSTTTIQIEKPKCLGQLKATCDGQCGAYKECLCKSMGISIKLEVRD